MALKFSPFLSAIAQSSGLGNILASAFGFTPTSQQVKQELSSGLAGQLVPPGSVGAAAAQDPRFAEAAGEAQQQLIQGQTPAMRIAGVLKSNPDLLGQLGANAFNDPNALLKLLSAEGAGPEPTEFMKNVGFLESRGGVFAPGLLAAGAGITPDFAAKAENARSLIAQATGRNPEDVSDVEILAYIGADPNAGKSTTSIVLPAVPDPTLFLREQDLAAAQDRLDVINSSIDAMRSVQTELSSKDAATIFGIGGLLTETAPVIRNLPGLKGLADRFGIPETSRATELRRRVAGFVESSIRGLLDDPNNRMTNAERKALEDTTVALGDPLKADLGALQGATRAYISVAQEVQKRAKARVERQGVAPATGAAPNVEAAEGQFSDADILAEARRVQAEDKTLTNEEALREAIRRLQNKVPPKPAPKPKGGAE